MAAQEERDERWQEFFAHLAAWMVNVHLKSGDRVKAETILGRPSLAQRERAKAARKGPADEDQDDEA
ncbi:MAG: hypothetical protein ACRDH5_14430 [bacterium]